jgi:hypothetical protein
VVDALGQPAGHRPGYCFSAHGSTDQARGAAEAAYIMHKDWLQNAWRRKPVEQRSEHKPAASLEELRRQSEAARERYIQRVENAWRRTTL